MDAATPYDFSGSSCSREATQVRFMYFSPEEIKSLSTVEVNDVSTFDEWGVPVRGGLHSLEMGPIADCKHSSMVCQTCGLDRDCPGHLGHIQLAAPLFNPFMMNNLLQLLRQTCHKCHKFKCREAVTDAFVRQLEQLSPGEIPEPRYQAASKPGLLSEISPDPADIVFRVEEITRDGTTTTREVRKAQDLKQTKQAAENLVAALDAKRAEQDAAAAAARAGQSKGAHGPQVSSSLEAIRQVIRDFITNLPASCARCQAQAKWRREGFEALFVTQKGGKEQLAIPEYARDLLRDLWKNEARALRFLAPAAKEIGPDAFFLERLLVPPTRFRPPKKSKENENSFTLHRHSAHFKGILLANQQVQETVSPAAAKEKLAGKGAGKDAPKLELHQAIRDLQIAVNSLMDRMKSGRNAKLSEDGVRQLLEKKEGLFRMKMMGKRVNFAARSVISPDPNIEPSEIGVPVEIASNLYYPEVVTPFNVEWLRSLVLRGNVYPGAFEVHIPKGDGSKIIQSLQNKSEEDRKSLAKQLLSELKSGKPPYTVFRHLMDGDPLLVNRQPTLHKPGIMAHTAKVLKREATIRLHYVNCNTYNADFDGDEMNLHAPQDPISRMEALAIAKADQQYLVPTSGKPLRGLIQDHVIAGTMLTKRDSFYTKTEVCLLLYAGLRHALEASSKPTAMSFLTLRPKARKTQAAPEESVQDAAKKFKDRPWLSPSVQMNAQKFKVELDPPAVLRPRPLWSGKQVLSMLLKHLIKVCSEGKEADTSKGVNLDGKSKTPGDIWNGRLDGDKEEATVTFRGSDLLQGVLDKASFGAETAGITHMCFELMGGRLVSLWLSGIARLFTLLLQMRGFTCAYEDLVLRPEIDEKRTELVKGARLAAKEVAEQWIHKHGAGEELAANPTPSALSKASKHLFQQKETVEHFEGLIIGKMKEFWSGMINKCIPIGQRLPVPRNCFASMVQTGAKGSKVNQSQVSCCLGQQELEGRLPPLMTTQRSLPCFAVRDLSNRTRGYIADRFLTGIRPQEFFFHCMAGREGLVDTAVKTSRSGYLQRCLVKHLEALKVSYDHTVRDSDGSVLQFLYGEDGVDVTRATYLFKFDELRSNFHFFAQPVKSKLQQMSQSSQAVDIQCARLFLAARQAAKDGNLPKALEAVEALLKLQTELDSCSLLSLKALRKKLRSHIKKGTAAECDRLFDPISAVLGPSHYYGATSEKHEEALQKYLKQSTESGQMTSKEAKHFERAMHLKFQRTLAEPGEAVGVIAAQSMGEPSTQMTLNTFHLAGHGGANVTLGIPRLREIIQTASRSCSTPLMTVPVLSAGPDGKPASLQQRIAAAQALKRRFRKVTVMDCVARLVVNESVRLIGSKAVWVYHCRIEFMPLDELCKAVPYVTRERLKNFVETTVVRELKKQLSKIISEAKDVKVKVAKRSKAAATGTGDTGGDAPEAAEAEEEEPEDSGKKAKKKRRRILGAEDKAEEEERVADAMDAEADGGDAEEEESLSSGFYTSVDGDDERAIEDPDEQELEGAEGTKGDEEEDEEGADEGKRDKDEEEQEEEEAPAEGGADMASPKGKRAKKGDTGGTKEEREDDEKDGGSGGIQKAKTGTQEGSKNRKTKTGSSARQLGDKAASLQSQAEKDLGEALKEDNLVWRSELRGDSMSIIVNHNHSQCPHSLFVGEVLRGVLSTATLQDPACDGVEAVHVKVENDKVSLECEGINLFGLLCLPPTLVAHSQIYTNNIRHILETFGVEAARASVVREVRGVFGHYGIQVDHRHLSLIADYMAQAGGLRPFNRMGMVHCTSPLLQMSYETTMQFLSGACKEDLLDNMISPASAIVLGQPPAVGTGVVNLLVDLDPPDPPWKKQRRFKFPV